METFIVGVLLSFLVIIAIGIIVLRDLLAAVILLGVYSLIAAGAFVVMDAVDVAFTEAAVGAGISTILYLGALRFTTDRQKPRGHDSLPHSICRITAARHPRRRRMSRLLCVFLKSQAMKWARPTS